MPTLAVVYYSATGTTATLADAICCGAQELLSTLSYRVLGTDIVDGRFCNEDALVLVDRADAVVFGSPTYMGGPAAEFKAFADASGDRWSEGRWKDKVASGFTTGTCPNGDQSHTLSYFTVLAAQHGMIWCNLDIPGGCDPAGRNRLGTQVGLATQGPSATLAEEDILTTMHLGRRVASLTLRLAATKR